MEQSRKPERNIANPARLIHGLSQLAIRSVRAVDNALYEFDDHRPYNQTNYPTNWTTETPVQREEDLLDAQDY